MSEQAQTPSPGAKAKPIGGSSTPPIKFPKFEIPAPFREFAEKSASQAKEACERMKSTNDEMADRLKESYATASKGVDDYGLQLMEAGRAWADSAFNYATQLLEAKSLSEWMELTATHTREQLDVLTEQSRKLTSLAQKVANETAEPIKEGVAKAFKQAA